MTATPELGWRLATFLLDTLVPAPRYQVSAHALFRAYGQWCAERKAVPLLEAVFLDRVAEIAASGDIRILQAGANVVFHDVTLGEGYRRES